MKNLIGFFLFILLITCFSFGQNIDINDISVRFCSNDNNENLQKRVSLYSEAGKITQECLIIINNSDKTGYIDLHFVSQINTNQWEKACALPGNSQDVFVKYLEPSRSGLIYLDSNSEKKETFNINFPVWIWLKQGWCLAFFVANKWEKIESEWTFLSLVTRKASLFEIWIDDKKDFINKLEFDKIWKSSNKILIVLNKFKSSINRNSINKTVWISFGARNLWNINQELSFSGNLYWLLWYKKWFIGEKTIVDKDNLEYVEIGTTWLSLPEYQWLFWFRINMLNTPNFDFDTSHIPEEKLIGTTRKYTILFMLFSWVSIWFWFIIIVSVFMIYRIWKKMRWSYLKKLINLKKMFIKK